MIEARDLADPRDRFLGLRGLDPTHGEPHQELAQVIAARGPGA